MAQGQTTYIITRKIPVRVDVARFDLRATPQKSREYVAAREAILPSIRARAAGPRLRAVYHLDGDLQLLVDQIKGRKADFKPQKPYDVVRVLC